MNSRSLGDRFIKRIRDGKKSDSTHQTYRSHLKQFTNWCDDVGIESLSDVEYVDLDEHLNSMNSDGYSDSYISARMGFLRALYGFGYRKEILDSNPCDKLKPDEYANSQTEREKLSQKDTERFLSPTKIGEIVRHVPDPTLCHELMTRLQFETCMRAGELARIEVDNIDLETNEITIQSLKKRHGEVETRETWYYTDRTEELMRKWLNRGYRDGYAMAHESPYLFPRQKSERPRTQDVNEMVKKAAENAGLQEVIDQDAKGRDRYLITSHMLRHSGISFLVNKREVPIREVQQIAGHSSIDQTLEYTHEDVEARRESIQRKTANVTY